MDENKWQDIYRRLNEANQKINHNVISVTLTPGNDRQILAERAQQLAKVKISEESKEPPLEVIEFRLDNETYALECNRIKEVSFLESPVPIPGTPDFVLGIINIRGQILSVIDLGKFFELPTKNVNELKWVILLENEKIEFGIMAEEILGANSILLNEIQTSLPTLTGIRSQYLKGIARNRVVVLDAAKILADEKIIINQEIEL